MAKVACNSVIRWGAVGAAARPSCATGAFDARSAAAAASTPTAAAQLADHHADSLSDGDSDGAAGTPTAAAQLADHHAALRVALRSNGFRDASVPLGDRERL